jgi:hypothetical protein
MLFFFCGFRTDCGATARVIIVVVIFIIIVLLRDTVWFYN